MANRFGKGVPCLSVENCDEAIRYYCEVLGFRKDFDDAVLGRDVTLYAGVSRDELALTLNQHPPTWAGHRGLRRRGRGRAARGVRRQRRERAAPAAKDEPWGARGMMVLDLEGYQLGFESPIR